MFRALYISRRDIMPMNRWHHALLYKLSQDYDRYWCIRLCT